MKRSSEQSAYPNSNPIVASIYDEPVSSPRSYNEGSASGEEKKQEPNSQSSEGKLKLFLGGLYFQSEQDIRDYFSKIAPIVSLSLITDRSNTGSKGYAFMRAGLKYIKLKRV